MRHAISINRRNAEEIVSCTDASVALELQSFAMDSVCSEQAWQEHAAFFLRLAGENPDRSFHIHGPFHTFMYISEDHLIREAVLRRLEQTLKLCQRIRPADLVVHLCCPPYFWHTPRLERWVEAAAEFWLPWVDRFSVLGTRIVLENTWEPDHAAALALTEYVNHPQFKACLDVGHVNAFTDSSPTDWVKRLGHRIGHLHIHDNSGDDDRHLPLGRGTIDFHSLYGAVREYCPEAVLAIEVVSTPEKVLASLSLSRELADGPQLSPVSAEDPKGALTPV